MDSMTYGYIDSDKPIIYTATEYVVGTGVPEKFEIVRCRECRNVIDNKTYCSLHRLPVKQNGFCSWGERCS